MVGDILRTRNILITTRTSKSPTNIYCVVYSNLIFVNVFQNIYKSKLTLILDIENYFILLN